MSILTSLFTGVSGLNAHGALLSIIGNNVANVSTAGFKGSRGSFADVLSQSLGVGGGGQVGRGVFLSGVTSDFSQGTFETTNNVLDLGISGGGFFVVQDTSGTFYTRAGQFNLDRNGNVVNPQGAILQGFQVDSSGNLTGTINNLNFVTTSSPPNPTTSALISANLDSRVTIPSAFSVSNPAGTSNFSTAMTVYDSLGNGHLITVYFRKSAQSGTGNTWEWFAVVNSADNGNGTGNEVQAQGTLSFNASGALSSESAITYPTGGFDFSGGASQNQTIAFDFGTSIAQGGTGLTGTTQFGAASETLFQSQNGFSSGSLRNLSVNQDGVITGLFSNGQTRTLGQVVLATFTAQQGLKRVGENLFSESFDSGPPLLGAPNTDAKGSIFSSSLELSNVDLAEQFVNLITAQRGFQANSRIITTTDEILGELVNLRR